MSGNVYSPEGLSFSAGGNLHVTGYGSDNYAVFSPAGKLVRSHEFSSATVVERLSNRVNRMLSFKAGAGDSIM